MNAAAVLTKIATLQATVSGVVRAYDGNTPPESVEDTPCFVNIFGEAESQSDEATVEQSVSKEITIYPVTMLLLVNRGDLPDAATKAVPFVDRTLALFRANVTLGGLVTRAAVIKWRFGAFEYPPGQVWLGVRFVLQVREHAAVAYAAGS